MFFLSTLRILAQNVPPVAINDTAYVSYGDSVTVNILANDYDPDGDSLYLFFVGSPANGYGIRTYTYNTITFKPSIYAHGWVNILYKLLDYVNPAIINSKVSVFVENPCRDTLNINNVSALINSYGNQFWDLTGGNHYVVPKSGQASSIFNFSMWIAGRDVNGQYHIAAERYRVPGQDFYSGPVSTNYDNQYIKTWTKVWKLRRSEIAWHNSHWWQPGYIPITAIATWPGNGNTALGESAKLAPFKDVDGDNVYNPLKGDYPLIRGDMAIFSIYNDKAGIHSETQGEALGVEIHSMTYAFDCQQDSALWNTVFMHLEVYNRSTYDYGEGIIGLFIDGDLGSLWDDYVGTDVSRGSVFFYNGTNVDGTGLPAHYGTFPPAQSLTILAGPFMEPNTLDDPQYDSLTHSPCDMSINGFGFGNGDRDDERLGLMGSRYFNNSPSGPTSDPQIGSEYISYLRGNWRDGQACSYGGNGHPGSGATGPECRFMFPALTDPCNWGTDGIQPAGFTTGAGGSGPSWTELETGNPPADRRGIAILGPFVINKTTMQPLDIAFVTGRNYSDTNASAAITVMNQRIDMVRNYFKNDSTPCGQGSFSGINSYDAKYAKVKLYPNPATTQLYLDYDVDKPNAAYVISDVLGSTGQTGKLHKAELNTIRIESLNPGFYLLKVTDGTTVFTRKFVKH